MTQLKSINENDLYQKNRSNYFEFVVVKGDTEFEKSYEMKKIIVKRQRKYEKIEMI